MVCRDANSLLRHRQTGCRRGPHAPHKFLLQPGHSSASPRAGMAAAHERNVSRSGEIRSDPAGKQIEKDPTELNMQAFRKFAPHVLLVLVAAIPRLSLAADQTTPIVERGVAVKMRDGTILRADIYRPNTPGKFPILLTRTPYHKYDYL